MKENDLIRRSRVIYDKRTAIPRKIDCRVAIPAADKPEKAVVALLEELGSVLHLSTAKGDLELIQSKSTTTGSFMRFQQYIDGIPVAGGEVLVQIDASGFVRHINTNHEPKDTVINQIKDMRITKLEADEIMRKEIGEKFTIRPNGKLSIEKAFFKTDGGLRLAWQIIANTLTPAHDWHIYIDAESGKILSKEDHIIPIDGQGMVFNPNPVVTLNDNTIEDGVTAEATLNAERVSVTLNDIAGPVGGQYTLSGPFCDIINIANPNIGIPDETNANSFNYNRTDDDFEAVNVYYHIDALQHYIQDILDINDANNRTIDADPHDNTYIAAWYSPDTKDLHFSDSGAGQPDRGEDSDCMVHEYGHAIQDNMVPGWGTSGGSIHKESRSIGEGFCDILAVLYNILHGNGYQRQVFEDWIFVNQDLGDGLRGLRRVDHNKLYSAYSSSAGYYSNSEIWSGVLWNIFLAIGGDSATVADWEEPRDILLKSMIASNRKMTTSPSMPDAAEALMETHEELEDQCGRHLVEMIDEFHDRELLECQTGSDIRITGLWSQQDNASIRSWEQVEYGQDNWFYAMITNSGTVAARSLIVNFNFKSPFSTPVYSTDFRDNIISAVAEFDLLPGETRTVWGRWPKEYIPAIPAGQDHLHGCILAEIYNPVDHVPAGVTSIGASNGKLRQCNTNIIDLLPDETADFYFEISNFHIQKQELLRLEVVRPQRWPELPIHFSHYNESVLLELLENAKIISQGPLLNQEELLRAKPTTIRFLEASKIELENASSGEELTINLAADSSISVRKEKSEYLPVKPKADFVRNNTALVKTNKEKVIMLERGIRSGFPYYMKPRQRITLKVSVKAPADARPGDEFPVEFIQRNVKGEFIGGFDILVRIVDKKVKPIRTRKIPHQVKVDKKVDEKKTEKLKVEKTAPKVRKSATHGRKKK